MKNIYVGLSGGVDSAVSAALLQERGFSVTGVFIKIWQPEFIECTWREDRLDAMRVAASLGIPFRELDLSAEYRDAVITDLTQEYARGRTPNPDVLCNRHIKFGVFAQWARAEGADAIATGHYARISEAGELTRAADTSKDQSYFLWQLTHADLSRALFPIGDMKKSAVRSYAASRGLPVAQKRDSQGLCFVGQITLPEFLSHYLTLTPGDVVDEEGRIIGRHSGAQHYTRGQRHGFSTTSAEPHYVITSDVSRNRIVVSPDRSRAMTTTFAIESCNWLTDSRGTLTAHLRYHDTGTFTHVEEKNGITHITTDTPVIATPGQSIVLYRGDIVVGGGIVSG